MISYERRKARETISTVALLLWLAVIVSRQITMHSFGVISGSFRLHMLGIAQLLAQLAIGLDLFLSPTTSCLYRLDKLWRHRGASPFGFRLAGLLWAAVALVVLIIGIE